MERGRKGTEDIERSPHRRALRFLWALARLWAFSRKASSRTGFWLAVLPFWAVIWTLTWFVEAQRLVRVGDEALAAAVEGEGEAGDGGVGDGFEGGAEAARDAFDVADEGDVDLAV